MNPFIEWLNRVVDKVTSARFIVTIALVLTLCSLVNKSLDMAIKFSYNEKLFTVYKDLFLMIFGAFIGVVGSAVTFYFTRPDRKNTLPTNDD